MCLRVSLLIHCFLSQFSVTSHLDSVVSLRNARLVTSASSDVDLVSLNRRDAELLVGAEQLATYLFEVKPNVTSATHAFESEFSVDFRLRAGNEADVCTFRKTVKCERYQTLCRTKTEVLPVASHKQLQVRATVAVFPFFSSFLLFQCLPSLTVRCSFIEFFVIAGRTRLPCEAAHSKTPHLSTHLHRLRHFL